jgi:hypothetical protein
LRYASFSASAGSAVESRRCGAHTLNKYHFTVVAALGRGTVRRDVGAVGNSSAVDLQPSEHGFLNDVFREC